MPYTQADMFMHPKVLTHLW